MTMTTFFARSEASEWGIDPMQDKIRELEVDDRHEAKLGGLVVLRIGTGASSLSVHTDRAALERMHRLVGEWLIAAEATERVG